MSPKEILSGAAMEPLYYLLANDVVAGVVASLAVGPFIYVIDKAIIEASHSSKSNLFSEIVCSAKNILRRPRLLLHPANLMVTACYGVTYATANAIETVCQHYDTVPTTAATVSLVGTTAVNTSACISKDVAFTKMYGASTVTKRFPLTTVGLFGIRDLVTIASAFTLPPLLSANLVSSNLVPDQIAAGYTAQMISPVMLQTICAPIHLLALSYYNFPSAAKVERFNIVWAKTPSTTIAYMVRIAPAFGIGCSLNKLLIEKGRGGISRGHGA